MRFSFTVFYACFLICAGLLTLGACRSGDREAGEATSIRVFAVGSAEKPSRFNKDQGAHLFAFYDLEKDSLLFRYKLMNDGNNFRTVADQLPASDRDSFRIFAQALGHYPEGIIPVSGLEGSTYCGGTYVAAISYGKRTRYYHFIPLVNDTIDRFEHFLLNLRSRKWDDRVVPNERIAVDSEVVGMWKGTGYYDSLPEPYIVADCPQGVDLSQLKGTWRSISDALSNRSNSFLQLEFAEGGQGTLKRVHSGKVQRSVPFRYLLDKERNSITTKTDYGTLNYQIRQLSGSCCVLIGPRGDSIRYDRIR
jgi:hypothetical protein